MSRILESLPQEEHNYSAYNLGTFYITDVLLFIRVLKSIAFNIVASQDHLGYICSAHSCISTACQPSAYHTTVAQ